IASAVFFLGKLPDDNKPPKDAVPGKLVTEKGKTFWQATLPISPKAVGPLDVGVLMVDNVGLSSKEETVILLKEPVPPDTTIEGDIFVGDLLQPKLGVELRDDKGVVKASTATDANGHYKFTKVLPGAYHVTATKVDGAHGDKAVEVQAGQQKTGVDLSLLR
ncbi:MAG TPA: carboxypeptidase regulatory-like domain-containing protein, partial [Gemmataceae bacterium]|nr:carboxypeptidase regulatory-like domain-containing protein [Gemmataceae bacterium]